MASNYDNKMKALNYIKEQIITCALAPGAVIQVDEIAEHLGISKTPVREALLELQHDNYVNVVPRKRTTVSKISLRDLKDVYDARTLVECHLLATLSPSELESNRDMLLMMQRDWERVDTGNQSHEGYVALLNSDLKFHQALISMHSNQHLVRFCQELIYKSQRFWYLALFNNQIDVVRQEHLEILRSLIAGDTAAAASACQKHISVSKAMSILSE